MNVPGFGTLTRTDTVSALAGRSVLAGNLTVPAGTWRAVAIISDPVSSSTQTVEGTGSLAISVDHITHRAAGSQNVVAQVTVFENTGAWTPRAASTPDVVALAARPAAGTPLIGVHLFAIEPGDYASPDLYSVGPWLDLMPSGIDAVRMGIPWAALQPSSSAWDEREAAQYDAAFAVVAGRGLKVHLTIGTTPSWARSGGAVTDPPTSAATFETWVDAVLDRWGPIIGLSNIIALDPWNEINSATFFGGTASQAVGLIRAAHTGAAGRVPTGMCLAFADSTYLAGLFDAGLTTADFDVVDFHPYPIGFDTPGHTGGMWHNPNHPVNGTSIPDRYASIPSGFHLLDTVLTANGVSGKSFTISEVGLPDHPFDADPYLRIGTQRAADWLATMLDQASRIPNMLAVCVHDSVDRDDPGATWNGAFGLCRKDLSRRKKWASVAAVTA